MERFDRHKPVQSGVIGLINGRHPSLAWLFLQTEWTHCLAHHKRHRSFFSGPRSKPCVWYPDAILPVNSPTRRL